MFNLLPTGWLAGCLDLDEAYAGERMSWDEGQKHCTDNGANLIQFNSAAEQEQTCTWCLILFGMESTLHLCLQVPMPSPYRNVLFKEKVLVVVFLVFSFPNLVKHRLHVCAGPPGHHRVWAESAAWLLLGGGLRQGGRGAVDIPVWRPAGVHRPVETRWEV